MAPYKYVYYYYHSVFTGRIPLLLPNQQHHSAEGKDHYLTTEVHLSNITVTVYFSAKTSWHGKETKLRHCHPMYMKNVIVRLPSKLSLYGSGKSAGNGIFPATPFCPVVSVVSV